MNNANKQKNETFQLYWFEPQSNKYFPAGVAFHDEQFGEYRLKIDMYPDNQYYLKALNSTDETVSYRVEVVVKKNGKFHQRKVVGEGYSSSQTNGDIIMSLGPYTKKLLLGGK
ncbi:MAG: hypothetical protein CME70_11000 [Halobacteriovorax sp.]|nr:hypothetical protein [Halobacteriovorax sp.]|tara:strand:+ start:28261 stop:28599 length:339 start_codon:yes stop_codon:yes gene_type:complete